MFTTTEKKYLALTIFFLVTGSGIKACKHAKVKIGPRVDSLLVYHDSLEKASVQPLPQPQPGSLAPADSQAPAFDTHAHAQPLAFDTHSSDASQLNSTPGSSSMPKSTRSTRSTRTQTTPPAHKTTFTGKRSINQATVEELTSISGLGVKTAQFIVKYRNEHGPFRDLDDLLLIKGIGEKKLEKFRPFLIL